MIFTLSSGTGGTRRDVEESRPRHVCPWWVGYLLASPLRRLFENPDRLLAAHVRPGATVADLGCAMGFFSLPLARMVGTAGRVVAVDVQERMLRTLLRRARRKGLDGIIETRTCQPDDLGLDDLAGAVDFALAFHVVHETPQPESFLTGCRDILKSGGRLLLAEPKGHVSAEEWESTLDRARLVGLHEAEVTGRRKSHLALLVRP